MKRKLNILFLREASEVFPVPGEVLELEGVDGGEHQHGVRHHQPPEGLQQPPPQGVVHLGEGQRLEVRGHT